MSSERRRQLKEEFVGVHGRWPEWGEEMLDLDPDFFAAYAGLAGVPWRMGPLEPKLKELVQLAIAAATTNLHEPTTKSHVKRALDLGASNEEILETFELTAVLGIHAATVGVPILLEELAGTEQALDAHVPSAREQALKEQFIRERGYWSELWDGVLALDPDFFEAYLRFSTVPFERGALDKKAKELIYVAIDASTTHLFEPGIRIHIRNALAAGATAAEIMEVLELASVQGINTFAVGLPALVDEASRR